MRPFLLAPYDKPGSLRHKLRLRRLKLLSGKIAEIHAVRGKVRILDIGGTERFWSLDADLVERFNCQITLINTEPIETTRPRFTAEIGDACGIDKADNSFDLVHSNSVIEHVGDWPRKLAMAQEVRRLAPHYFVQTPNFWFPFEPHFQLPLIHWLPEQTRAAILMRVSPYYPKCKTVTEAMQRIEYCRLLGRQQYRELFPEADLIVEQFMGISKSLIACR